MPTFNTYSKNKNGIPEILAYDNISEKLKNQISFIWNNFFEQNSFPEELVKLFREKIHQTLKEETGIKTLHSNGLFYDEDPVRQVESYFSNLNETDKILDVIDISFYYMEVLQKYFDEKYYVNNSYKYQSAVEDLNTRFRENGVGYELINQNIIKIENKILHEKTITDTIKFLTNPIFENANEEFLKANDHYRHNRFQETMNECLKAFESTMKIICEQNNWNYNKEKDTAKDLISHLFNNGFFMSYQDNYLASLRQLLTSNIPTMRNKNSGHGQGSERKIVPESLAKYLLYSTGATITLLIDNYLERINQK